MIPILLYHQVASLSPELDPAGLTVTPEQFEQQMAYLARRNYRAVSLDEALQSHLEGRSGGERAVAITFDDGFRDLYTVVAPILARFGFTATVFLVTGRMGQDSDWKGQDGRLAAPLLSWEEARELQHGGIHFGAHTVTHPSLTEIGHAQARDEIVRAREMIHERLGTTVEYFAYPYSRHDAAVRALVAKAGYRAACGGDRGVEERWNLHRAQIGREDTARTFALKAAGWYHRFFRFREQSTVGPSLRRGFRHLRKWAT